MGKDEERDKAEQGTAKPDQKDKKLTDLPADEKDEQIKGGAGMGSSPAGAQVRSDR
jgi:hypothetical protein